MKWILLLLVVSCGNSVCVEVDIIKDIGGCDRNGYCSFVTSSGFIDSDYRPVKGQSVCIKREWR